MSHFMLWVFGCETEAELAATLQPYHEFECTGTNDQYVVEIDKTQELRDQYENKTTRRFRNLADGGYHSPYLDRFYRDPTPEETAVIGPVAGSGTNGKIQWSSNDWGDGLGYRAKIHFLPEGFEEVNPHASSLMSFRDYCIRESDYDILLPGEDPDYEKKHKYGYLHVDAQGEVTAYVRRTNPNRKWDYWVIGNRYTGRLKLKPGIKSVLGKQPMSWSREDDDYFRTQRENGSDFCRWGDVDLQGMRETARVKAHADFDIWERCFSKFGRAKTWNQCFEEHRDDLQKARETYHDQRAVREWKDITKSWDLPDDFGYDRDVYVNTCMRKAVIPFAMLKGTTWLERGNMLMFGAVANESTTWLDTAEAFLAEISPDTMVACVDCHI